MKHLFMILAVIAIGCSSSTSLLLDDFEGTISKQTVDYGSGNGSSVTVTATVETLYSGSQALKIEYDSVQGGYMWIARGYDLDVPGAALWSRKPRSINWKNYKGISFYLYGEAKGALLAVDIKEPGKEILRVMVTDDTRGWKKVVCPFNQFVSRTDWQPQGAVVNKALDFPVMSFQFEVKSLGKGTMVIDKVELIK